MNFRLLRIFDRILGLLLYIFVIPLPMLVDRFFRPKRKAFPNQITILKLCGGGSLLMAMPALQGLKTQYPQARITLVCSPETRKFAELLDVFYDYALIDSSSILKLVTSGLKALLSVYRQDVFIDLEPHSSLAPIFTALTYSVRRIGFVKAHETHRARCYTDPLYFNIHAPIYRYYEQATSVAGARPVTIESCRNILMQKCAEGRSIIGPEHPQPVVYISAFTSVLSPERMMPINLWISQLSKVFGSEAPFTVVLGAGADQKIAVNNFAAKIQSMLPSVKVITTCGTRNLREAMMDILKADEFWGVDSGPLHMARLLGKKCVSFWGPSNPAYRLNPIDGLNEQVFYRAYPCSPCVHVSLASPCKGDNQCMKKIFSDEIPAPITRF